MRTGHLEKHIIDAIISGGGISSSEKIREYLRVNGVMSCSSSVAGSLIRLRKRGLISKSATRFNQSYTYSIK